MGWKIVHTPTPSNEVKPPPLHMAALHPFGTVISDDDGNTWIIGVNARDHTQCWERHNFEYIQVYGGDLVAGDEFQMAGRKVIVGSVNADDELEVVLVFPEQGGLPKFTARYRMAPGGQFTVKRKK